MLCIKCSSKRSKVVESRRTSDSIRRRRECLDCNERFTTFESVLKENKPHREPMIKIRRRSKGKVYENKDSFLVLGIPRLLVAAGDILGPLVKVITPVYILFGSLEVFSLIFNADFGAFLITVICFVSISIAFCIVID